MTPAIQYIVDENNPPFENLPQTQSDQPQQTVDEEEEEPLRWSEILSDIQNFARQLLEEEGRCASDITDQYALYIWSKYVETVWDESLHSELNVLAGQHRLQGILPSTF